MIQSSDAARLDSDTNPKHENLNTALPSSPMNPTAPFAANVLIQLDASGRASGAGATVQVGRINADGGGRSAEVQAAELAVQKRWTQSIL